MCGGNLLQRPKCLEFKLYIKFKYISSPLLAHQHLIKTSAITHWSSLRNTLQGTLVTHFPINHCTPQEFCIWMDTAGTRLIKLPVWSVFFFFSCESQDEVLKSISLMGLWEVLKYTHTLVHFILVQDFVKQRKLIFDIIYKLKKKKYTSCCKNSAVYSLLSFWQ